MNVQGQGTAPDWVNFEQAKDGIATVETRLTPAKSCIPGSGWFSAAWIKLKNGFSQEAIINELSTRLTSDTIDGQTLRWFSPDQLKGLLGKTPPNQTNVCKVYTQALHF